MISNSAGVPCQSKLAIRATELLIRTTFQLIFFTLFSSCKQFLEIIFIRTRLPAGSGLLKMAAFRSAALLALVSLLCYVHCTPSIEEYLVQRAQLMKDDSAVFIGSSWTMTDKEVAANEILMKHKEREFAEGFKSNGVHFIAANHFFHIKDRIEKSNVFKIIRMLPKGSVLHIHDVTVPRAEYVVQDLSYWDNLYVCNDNNYLSFHFFGTKPTAKCDKQGIVDWQLVKELREQASSKAFIDAWFLQSLNMYTPKPDIAYPHIDIAWKVFEATIATTGGIALYEPALRKYFYQTLKEFYDDNVMYVEERGLLTDVYRLDQTVLTPVEILKLFREVSEEFMKDHEDFWGVKYIYAPHRFHPAGDLDTIIDYSIEMKKQEPNFFAGFDLVGQEDRGTPLKNYLPQLLKAAENNVKFFFHAGETAWHGTTTDENLIDAILLNTTRLGHAYALASHPHLADIVKQRKIAVEVCPISNQVLKLVEDIRNHPAVSLMKQDFPLVVSSDDPGIWGASGLSYDWYYVFMGMANAHADIRFLKQLALNSIEYSAMTDAEKTSAKTKWEGRWDTFLDNVISRCSATDCPEPIDNGAALRQASIGTLLAVSLLVSYLTI